MNTPKEKILEYFGRMQDESYLAFLDMLFFDLPKRKPSQIPMLVLGAGKDRIFSPRDIYTTARDYNAQAEIFPDMGHDMMLEEGWQNVADA